MHITQLRINNIRLDVLEAIFYSLTIAQLRHFWQNNTHYVNYSGDVTFKVISRIINHYMSGP